MVNSVPVSDICSIVRLMTVLIQISLYMHSSMDASSGQFQAVIQHRQCCFHSPKGPLPLVLPQRAAYRSSGIIFLGMISSEWPPGVMAGNLSFWGCHGIRDFPLAASDHVPMGNNSQSLILYVPQAISELHFHFAASTLMHCSNPPSGWSTSHIEGLKLYLSC